MSKCLVFLKRETLKENGNKKKMRMLLSFQTVSWKAWESFFSFVSSFPPFFPHFLLYFLFPPFFHLSFLPGFPSESETVFMHSLETQNRLLFFMQLSVLPLCYFCVTRELVAIHACNDFGTGVVKKEALCVLNFDKK